MKIKIRAVSREETRSVGALSLRTSQIWRHIFVPKLKVSLWVIKIFTIFYPDTLYIICNRYYLLYKNLLFLESDDGKVDKDDEDEVDEINDENEIEREMDAVFRHDQVTQQTRRRRLICVGEYLADFL